MSDRMLQALDQTVEHLALSYRITEGSLENQITYEVLKAFEIFRANYRETSDE